LDAATKGREIRLLAAGESRNKDKVAEENRRRTENLTPGQRYPQRVGKGPEMF